MGQTPTTVARALYAALEAGEHGHQLARFFTEDAITIEHPNRIKPRGGRADLPAMLAASNAGAGLLSEQRYDVRSCHDVGTMAVVRATWTGVIARDLGQFREGQRLVAHLAQFIDICDGRIARIETFDCYEPFD
ncbi:MAG: nuclear transport factor 2 family protein [Myxococcales bacterium]|nr:nuclear transport factor 2 family protein [Myxococcales bacterium]